MTILITQAVSVLQQGGVIAYPTEYCFGLGCDPRNEKAVQRILEIKHRSIDQGLILIAGEVAQVNEYANLSASPVQKQILTSWPGPVTWTLPLQPNVPRWLTGEHNSIAMRLTMHSVSAAICQQYGSAIVSTSANRHTQPALLTFEQVIAEMGGEVDYVLEAKIGSVQGSGKQASQIRDGRTGRILRQ